MKSKPFILIVEDNHILANAIATMLEFEKKYCVHIAHSLTEAKQAIEKQDYQLIIQDRMLGDGDGLYFIQSLKKEHLNIRVLFLSVKNTSSDRIQGLKVGGDDYLAKPFDSEELLLRVQKQLHIPLADVIPSHLKKETQHFEFGSNKIDFENKVAINFKGKEINLTKLEWSILDFFVVHQNKLITRERIFEQLWGGHYNPSSRIVDNYLVKMRKHFEANPEKPKHFRSKRGNGYMFVV